ncbi:hypothetical protein ZOSMA_163G00020 [Zostera marina]|uniref:Phosphoglycolate phosphatase n=1 Tax=Zostera marina TaxID=29655 RepID=A0A0K9PW32_ZOSMR|nr:hypothetical protein ZOSMA_163G00020 [Zostera marina]
MEITSNGGDNVAQRLSLDNVRSLVDSVDAFLFDCDGVIWKANELIDGVAETLTALRSMGKKIMFVTNNSTKSRKQYSTKFLGLGLSVSEDEIFCSSFAAAMFLKVNKLSVDKNVYVIGEEGILEEVELAGYKCIGGPEDGKKLPDLRPNSYFEHNKNVGAVIVGFDHYINFYKLQ